MKSIKTPQSSTEQSGPLDVPRTMVPESDEAESRDPAIVGDPDEELEQLESGVLEFPGRGGLRLDRFLTERIPGASRAEIQRWIKSGCVTIDGAPARASRMLESADTVRIIPPSPTAGHLPAEDMPLSIIYEDDDLLVVDKPAGLAVHPGAGIPSGTLANGLMAHCGVLSVIGGQHRPGIVHRLDKDTSGLLVAAKNDASHRSLAAQIASRSAGREYSLISWGHPTWKRAEVKAAIGRDERRRIRMSVVDEEDGGRRAETLLDLVEELPLGSRLHAALRTGRTHQIRVHCEYIGLPIVGDPLYGNHAERCRAVKDRSIRAQLIAVRRQALHASVLRFHHPRTNKPLTFRSEPPEDWQQTLKLMRAALP